MSVLVTQLYLTICDPMDCSPPGSSVHRDSPGKNMGRVAMPSSRGSSQTRNRTRVSCIAGGFFTAELPGKHIMTPNANNSNVPKLMNGYT